MRNDRHPRGYGGDRSRDYTIDDLLGFARGQWYEIFTDAGLPSDALMGRRGRPCPKCGGRDRFCPLADFLERGAVLCRHCFHRGTDPRPGDGIATLRWWLGCDAAEALRWLRGWLGIGPSDPAPVRRPVERRLSIPDRSAGCDRWADLSAGWSRAMRPEWLRRAAGVLGVSVDSLVRLSVGWAAEHRATSWPMRDDAGRVIGVRLRCPQTARKWAVRGSRAGLFYGPGLLSMDSPKRLWITEGPTDTAALLSADLLALGVPGASGGRDLVVGICRRLRPIEIVVMADADGPGRDGAERLADGLLPVVPAVRVIAPEGANDARAWVASGAGRDVMETAADAAPVRSLSVRGCNHG